MRNWPHSWSSINSSDQYLSSPGLRSENTVMTKTEKDPAHGTCLLMGETNPQETNLFRWCLGMPEEREDSATRGADEEALSGLDLSGGALWSEQ